MKQTSWFDKHVVCQCMPNVFGSRCTDRKNVCRMTILILVAFFRELLGSGNLWGMQVIPDFLYESWYVNNGLMLLSPMALITVGIIIWIQRSFNKKLIEKG